MDFVHDNLACGRAFRTLNIRDAFSSEALEIKVDTSLNGKRLVRVLEHLAAPRGKPQLIQVDNGSEFRGIDLDRVPSGCGLQKPSQVAFHLGRKANTKWQDRIVQRTFCGTSVSTRVVQLRSSMRAVS